MWTMSLATVIESASSRMQRDEKWGHVVYRATLDVTGPTEVASTVGSGHSFTVDEPVSFGGGDAGPGPVEYALAALGSCQAITYQFWAAHLGVVVDTIHIVVEGDLDLRGFFGVREGVRPGLGAVRVNVCGQRTGVTAAIRRTGGGGGRALPRPGYLHRDRRGGTDPHRFVMAGAVSG